MEKTFFEILKIVIGLYILLCGILYIFQENFIFFPHKLEKDYQFKFASDFEEYNIKATDGKMLNGLLFKAESSKGLIFYLHGNAGSLSSWGEVAKTYTDLNYDIFILDYRSYGKSEGKINGQKQLFSDCQIVYNELKKIYAEDKIIILGYSIGSGLASKLASTNNPSLLILQAPFYNLSDLVRQIYPIIPTFLLKYKLETNKYLKNCKMPIVIFHGNKDEIIYFGSSLKLKDEFKQQITLITLEGQRHNGMTTNPNYLIELEKILAK